MGGNVLLRRLSHGYKDDEEEAWKKYLKQRADWLAPLFRGRDMFIVMNVM